MPLPSAVDLTIFCAQNFLLNTLQPHSVKSLIHKSETSRQGSILDQTRDRKVYGIVLFRKQTLKNVVVEVRMILAGTDAVRHKIGLQHFGLHGATAYNERESKDQ